MPATSPSPLANTAAAEFLRRGQAFEASGHLGQAVAAYDECIRLAEADDGIGTPATRRMMALAWMNRGNALRKQSHRGALAAAVDAYDRALGLLGYLFSATQADHGLRNSLGAAHLNRAAALLAADAPRAALGSADRAIEILGELPLDQNLFYRTNLAGAWLNRANALLSCDLELAQIAARTALDLIETTAADHATVAPVAFAARSTLLTILGRRLLAASDQTERLLTEAGDLIDDGLVLARAWEERRVTAFRPWAAQFFMAGAVLYSSQQPHFLAEFLEENHAFAQALPQVRQTAIARARARALERVRLAEHADSFPRTFATLTELSALAEHFLALGSDAVVSP